MSELREFPRCVGAKQETTNREQKADRAVPPVQRVAETSKAERVADAKQFLLDKFSERDDDLIVNICAWLPDGGRGIFLNSTLAEIYESNCVQEFLEANSDRNIYFGHNLCDRIPKRGKASVGDLADINHLFADIDPPKSDIDLEAFKADSLKKLTNLGLPMTVVDSGGGLQMHIDLMDKLEVAEAKKYNSMFLWVLESDPAVKNPAHLARMPFTTNYPNEIKRKAGRVACLTKVVR